MRPVGRRSGSRTVRATCGTRSAIHLGSVAAIACCCLDERDGSERWRMTSGRVHEVFIEGVGFWASRLPGWAAAREILTGRAPAPAAPAPRPSPALLPPAERRRAPDTVALALEVAARACEAAGRDPKSLASVFASTHGDLAISDAICDTLAKTPSLTSPTKFHNSVHNAAAGYWTIGTGCLKPYTSVSGYYFTFGEGL